jgi:hypothetical protein
MVRVREGGSRLRMDGARGMGGSSCTYYSLSRFQVKRAGNRGFQFSVLSFQFSVFRKGGELGPPAGQRDRGSGWGATRQSATADRCATRQRGNRGKAKARGVQGSGFGVQVAAGDSVDTSTDSIAVEIDSPWRGSGQAAARGGRIAPREDIAPPRLAQRDAGHPPPVPPNDATILIRPPALPENP